MKSARRSDLSRWLPGRVVTTMLAAGLCLLAPCPAPCDPAFLVRLLTRTVGQLPSSGVPCPALPCWSPGFGPARLYAADGPADSSRASFAEPAESREAAPPAPADDVQDLVLLFTARPLVVRLHLRIEGQGFRRIWRENMTADRAEPATDSPAATAPPTPPASDAAPLVVREAYGLGRRAGPALFPLIDADHDGRLAPSELQRAASAIAQRDFDDNGLVGPDELILDKNAEVSAATRRSSVLLIDPGGDYRPAAAAALAHYDADGDGKLQSPAEVQLAAGPFAEADANRDGRLDAAELEAYLRRTIDAELSFSFGRRGSVDGWGRMADDIRARKKVGGGFKLVLDDAAIDFRRNNRNPADAAAPTDFAALDRDGNGYLDDREATGEALAGQPFAAADADGDGQIFAEELETFLAARRKRASGQMLLEISDQGQELFALLDDNQDGLLAPRELQRAPTTLSARDANGNGLIESHELSHEVLMEIGRGLDSLGLATPAASARIRPADAETNDGPLWFRKMDRNGDGDVSRREFLGPAAKFAALDADGDGLISAAEAGDVASSAHTSAQ